MFSATTLDRTAVKVFLLSWAILFVFPLHVTGGEKMLENSGFETGNLKGWRKMASGDGKGRIQVLPVSYTGDYGVGIYATTGESWTFLQQRLRIEPRTRLTLSAWVRSDSSEAELVLTDGENWGGSMSGHTVARDSHSGSGKWERLVCSLTVEEGPVSASIGFDYRDARQQLIVDDMMLARGSQKVPSAPQSKGRNRTTVCLMSAAAEARGEILERRARQLIEASGKVLERENLPGGFVQDVRNRVQKGRNLLEDFQKRIKSRLSEKKFISKKTWKNLAGGMMDYVEDLSLLALWNRPGDYRLNKKALPASLVDSPRVEIYAARNERQASSLMVANLSDTPVEVQFEVADLSGPEDVPAERLELREAVFVPSQGGGMFADPLPRLNEGHTVLLPPSRRDSYGLA